MPKKYTKKEKIQYLLARDLSWIYEDLLDGKVAFAINVLLGKDLDDFDLSPTDFFIQYGRMTEDQFEETWYEFLADKIDYFDDPAPESLSNYTDSGFYFLRLVEEYLNDESKT